MAGPLPRRRRAQMSELMRSESCQSGPCSSTTTFLPARASTAANMAPAAPAPTMTASAFSKAAMSPAPLGKDMGHVRHAEPGKALHGAVGDIDRVVAQRAVDERLRRALPALDLVLAQAGDEVALLGVGEVDILSAKQRLAHPINPAQGCAIEIDIGRADFADADGQQRVARRQRQLLVDEMRDAGLARAKRKRFAHRFERP